MTTEKTFDRPDGYGDAFQLDGTFKSVDGQQIPQMVEGRMTFPTRPDAEAFVARFPKSLRLQATTLSYHDGVSYGATCGYVKFHADLIPSRTNMGINEAGLKRYWSLRRHLGRNLIDIEWAPKFLNSYQTEAAFHAAVR